MSHPKPIEHIGDEVSNEVRRRISRTEPKSLRTPTSSMAVIKQSAGSFHWTPEGHKLADFSSGVLVANLGHNPISWWNRVLQLLGVSDLREATGDYLKAGPLTAYNAATGLEAEACERLLANLRNQAGGDHMEQVLWAASGSEAIQRPSGRP